MSVPPANHLQSSKMFTNDMEFKSVKACAWCCRLVNTTEGGADYVSLALGYYLSGFQPCG